MSGSRNRYWSLVVAASMLLAPGPARVNAQPAIPIPLADATPVTQPATPSESADRIGYGQDGLEMRAANDRFRLVVGGRAQFRLTTPFADDPLAAEDVTRERQTEASIRRARFKAWGHLFTPRVTFNLQYDLVNTWLLDARVNYEFRPWLQLRAGQWKADYNRERVASSGEQQMVERSVVNRVFNIDRQNGMMVHGRAGEGRRSDSTYWLGVFNGGGRSRGNDDGRPLWVARYQWNVAGEGVGLAGSDLTRSSRVRAIVALGASSNQSAYTRFASDGAGQVEDLPPAGPGAYRLAQWVIETAVQWRGVSMQQEYHWKQATNRLIGPPRLLDGVYVQGGFFPHDAWQRMPSPLEVVARYATVDPNLARPEDHREEVTLGANWFVRGHRNKVSADASRLRFDTPDGFAQTTTRLRLQWDVSF